jgi:hypothetical protein
VAQVGQTGEAHPAVELARGDLDREVEVGGV